MQIESLEVQDLTQDRLISIIREQGRRLEAQRGVLSSLNRLKGRDVKNTNVFEAFGFFLSVLFNKAKLW